MFISKLIDNIEHYDPYAKHRLNGFKVVYIFFVLMFCNLFLSIENPYFYFFYLPLTAMSAVVLNDDLKVQYITFIYAITATCITALILNFFSKTPSLFILSAFLLSLALYNLAIDKYKSLLPIVPIVLSLGAYSLNYPSISFNKEVLASNFLVTLLSTVIILSALILFPLSYYYNCWRRAFLCFISELTLDLSTHRKSANSILKIRQAHHCQMAHFAKMLPQKKETFSVIKINLLCQQLSLKYSKANNAFYTVSKTEKEMLIENLEKLQQSIINKSCCQITSSNEKTLAKIINSWNQLCLAN